jgi:hypothetical protein
MINDVIGISRQPIQKYLSTILFEFMWKPLHVMQIVQPGDKIRYVSPVQHLQEAQYQVVKTDLHYFIIIPVVPYAGIKTISNKVVRYFDIGYNILLEIWVN